MEDLSVSHAQGQPPQPHAAPQRSQPIPRDHSVVVPVLRMKAIKRVVEDESKGIRLQNDPTCSTSEKAECIGLDLVGSVTYIRTNYVTVQGGIAYEIPGDDIPPDKANALKLTFDNGAFRATFAERGDAEGAGNVEVRPRVFEIDNPITFVVKLDKPYKIPLVKLILFEYERPAVPARRLEGDVFIRLQSQDGLLHQTIKASYDKGAPATLRDIKNLLVEPQQVGRLGTSLASRARTWRTRNSKRN